MANRVGIVLSEPQIGLARYGEWTGRHTDHERAAAGEAERGADR